MSATAEKSAPRPRAKIALMATPLAWACSFVVFMAAGQTLTSRSKELFDAMNVELPYVAAIPAENPITVAIVFVVLGLAMLALTRVRVSRGFAGESAWLLLQGGAIFAALVGVTFIYSSNLVFMKLQQCLVQ